MAVKVYSPVFPSVEVFGAHDGIASATGVNQTVSLTFTPTEGTLFVVPYGDTVSQFQLEVGPTPSSYIPTNGSTVTRAAETLTAPAANLPWPTPNVIGDELVTNGTFDTDVSGWTNNGMATFEVQSGRLRIIANTNGDSVYQDVTTVSGKTYVLTFDYEQVGGGSLFDGTGIQWVSGSITGTGQVSHIFIGSGNDRIEFKEGSPSNDADFFIDNISIREIDPLAVSIQMEGLETFADEGSATQEALFDWRVDANNRITLNLDTDSTKVGTLTLTMANGSGTDETISTTAELTPGVNDPFNVAIVCTSNEIGIALDGTAETRVSHSIGLPDLSGEDATLGGNGTRALVRAWNQDIGDTGIAGASS